MILTELPRMLIPVVDHLWESTLSAVAAGLLTLMFRKNRAHVRYCLWLASSMKFLIPFSILVTLGSHLGRHTAAPTASSNIPFVIGEVSQPFALAVPVAATHPLRSSFASVFPPVLAALWAIGLAVVVASWWRRWGKCVRRFAGHHRWTCQSAGGLCPLRHSSSRECSVFFVLSCCCPMESLND